MIKSILLFSVIVATFPAVAETQHMKCKNAVRYYAVTFDTETRILTTRSDDQTGVGGLRELIVLAVNNTSDGLVVSGRANMSNGPAFRALFSPLKKMEWFVDNKLFQIDACW
jgi:hypothetical protein